VEAEVAQPRRVRVVEDADDAAVVARLVHAAGGSAGVGSERLHATRQTVPTPHTFQPARRYSAITPAARSTPRASAVRSRQQKWGWRGWRASATSFITPRKRAVPAAKGRASASSAPPLAVRTYCAERVRRNEPAAWSALSRPSQWSDGRRSV